MEWEICRRCGGAGELLYSDGHHDPCPLCGGRGQTKHTVSLYHYKDKPTPEEAIKIAQENMYKSFNSDLC